MRDRLIEILKKSGASFENALPEEIADYLLKNGVIVPPVKVGQTVYCIRYDKARKPFVKPLGVLSVTICGKGEFTIFTTREDMLGKTVFLAREEAEKALAERSKNGKATLDR
jgi:hypothetical protein